MDKYGIIGFPVKYSFSPKIHNPAFKHLALNAEYKRYEIPPDIFTDEILKLKKANIKGLNVTVPYKQKILSFLDETDPLAAKVGAVNTIKKKGSKWIGYNTDLYGFLLPLRNYFDTIQSVLVIGAGGAANAICFALIDKLKLNILDILNRSKERAELLKEKLESHLNPEIKILSKSQNDNNLKYDLIVNTTNVGMANLKNEIPFNIQNNVHDKTIIYDLIYNPEHTLFLQAAQKLNLTTINGLDMLIGQAKKSFEIWTGQKFPDQVIDRNIFY
ncbi:MAG: shikimate dehydrogenase [Calditrichaeota bacterium]|nr:shikimate dehydrogenase [Calditrichota bacterium]